MIDYKVKKTEDCIIMDTKNWIQNSMFEIQKLNGKKSISYITEVIDVHESSSVFKNSKIKKGAYVLLSKVASEIASMRSYEIDNKSYFNAPIMQVMGIFKNNEISLSNLEMLYDKILIKKLEKNNSLIQIPETNELIGEVIKIGEKDLLKVAIGDVVLVKDNVSTPIRLGEETYYALEEKSVVGIIKENIEFINESILMESYVPSKLLNSSVLETPNINYEDLDYSSIYNRDLFKVKFLDKSIDYLKEEDIVLIRRDFTNYVYLNQDKYFLVNGKDWIEAKIEE